MEAKNPIDSRRHIGGAGRANFVRHRVVPRLGSIVARELNRVEFGKRDLWNLARPFLAAALVFCITLAVGALSAMAAESHLDPIVVVNGGSNARGYNLAFPTSGVTATVRFSETAPGAGAGLALQTNTSGGQQIMDPALINTGRSGGNGATFSHGTMTVTFNRPVTNFRIWASNWVGSNAASTARGRITATGGATFSTFSGSGLTLAAGNTQATWTGVTGTAHLLTVNGTGTTYTFDLATLQTTTGGVQGVSSHPMYMAFQLDEDWPDAPASYGPATHLINSQVWLGASAPTPDLQTTVYTSSNPFPTTGNPRASANALLDSDDAYANPLPDVEGVAGSTYTLPAPLVNGPSSASSTVCAWIDFNRSGVFDNPSERACAAPGVNLTWTVPASTAYVAGSSYVRVRVGTQPAVVNVPSGVSARAYDGEVEDYTIALLPRVRLVKDLVPATDIGRFDLTISPTVSPPGSATLTNAGDNGAIPSVSEYVTVDLGTAVTFGETAAAGTNLASYSSAMTCLNRAGATVAAPPGVTGGTFTTMTSASSGSNLTPATQSNIDNTEVVCTLTNTRIAQQFSVNKAWGPGSTAGHTASVTTQGGAAQASFNSTAPTATTGTAVTVNAGDQITLPAETFGGGATAGLYATTVGCTGGSPLAAGTAVPATLTIQNNTTATVCTYTNRPITIDLAITKTNTPGVNGNVDQAADTVTGGSQTTYQLQVTNNGPAPAIGARVLDAPVSQLTCPGGTTVTCAPAAACAGPYTVGGLTTSPGIALGTLNAGDVATLTFICSVQ